MPKKDIREDWAKIIGKSSRIFVTLYSDKLEEFSCNLYGYWKKNLEQSSNLKSRLSDIKSNF